jgi:catechol 2,3-dioxygenase-like lactoylglutathione lyase family enzyme
MIGYTMVGTRDLKRAIGFYDPLFEEMGIEKIFRDMHVASWGDANDEAAPKFYVGYPFNEKPATVGNGVMTAFLINGRSKIDRLYRIAIDRGGSDEGAPGFRPQYHESFYAAYVRDPDGNKIAFVCYDGQSNP